MQTQTGRKPSKVKSHLEWFKSTTERFREEISVFGQLSHDVMGIVKKDNELTFYDGKLRIVDSSRHVVADDLDPTQCSDYIGERSSPGAT